MTDPTANDPTVTPYGIAAWSYGLRKADLEASEPITEMDDRGKVTTVWPPTGIEPTYELAASTTGLTAAQEIRLEVFRARAHEKDGDELEADVVRFAALIEHGPDETPQIRDWACPDLTLHTDPRSSACPDPAIHDADLTAVKDRANVTFRALDDQRQELIKQRDDLKTELLETHADLEASLAREQIARAGLRALVRLKDGPRDEMYHVAKDAAWAAARTLLAGDQGEEAT